MALLTLRSQKGSPLTHPEMDGNFTSLNNDKLDAPLVGGRRVVDASAPLNIGGTLVDGTHEIGKIYKKTVVLTASQMRTIAQSPTAVAFIEAPSLGRAIIVHRLISSVLPNSTPMGRSPEPIRLVYENISGWGLDVATFDVVYDNDTSTTRQRYSVETRSPDVIFDADLVADTALAYDFFLARLDQGIPSAYTITQSGTGFTVGQIIEFNTTNSASSYGGPYTFTCEVTEIGPGGVITAVQFNIDAINPEYNFAPEATFVHLGFDFSLSIDSVILGDSSLKITAYYSIEDVLNEVAATTTTTTTSTTTAAPTTTTSTTTVAPTTTTSTTTASAFPAWPNIPSGAQVSGEIILWNATIDTLTLYGTSPFPSWPTIASGDILLDEISGFETGSMNLTTLNS